MYLKDLENISDSEKIDYFDDLLDYAKKIQEKNAEFLIFKHRLKKDNEKYLKEQEQLLEREIDKKVTAKMRNWKRQRVKELDKEWGRKIYLDTVKKVKDEKWAFEKEKARYRNQIIQKMAEAQKEKHPMLKLDSRQWKSRTRIYPLIMKNPERTNKSIALELKSSEMTVEQARNELVASWEVLNNKIWFVKQIIKDSAEITQRGQQEMIRRLREDPKGISNKDLNSIIKNNQASYSLFVWEATDNNWGMKIREEDQKLLDDVLDNQLEEIEDAEIEDTETEK